MISKNKRAVIVIGAFVVVAIVGLVGGAYALHLGPWEEQAQSLDLGPVIARVDGHPIYMHEAKARVQGLASIHGNVEDVLGKDWQERVLRSLVDDQILREQAPEFGITVTDEDIQAYLDKIQSLIGTDQTLEQWLTAQRMTMAELERRAELQIIGSEVYDAVTKDVTVTGAEVRNYYQTNKEQYTGTDGNTPSLLELSKTIRESLLQQKQDDAYAAWLESTRARSEIVVVMDDWWRNL